MHESVFKCLSELSNCVSMTIPGKSPDVVFCERAGLVSCKVRPVAHGGSPMVEVFLTADGLAALVREEDRRDRAANEAALRASLERERDEAKKIAAEDRASAEKSRRESRRIARLGIAATAFAAFIGPVVSWGLGFIPATSRNCRCAVCEAHEEQRKRDGEEPKRPVDDMEQHFVQPLGAQNADAADILEILPVAGPFRRDDTRVEAAPDRKAPDAEKQHGEIHSTEPKDVPEALAGSPMQERENEAQAEGDDQADEALQRRRLQPGSEQESVD